MNARERFAATVLGAAFVAAVAAVWMVSPPHAFAIAPALACFVVLLLAMLVRFDTPFGCTDATQLGFVPLLFALPLAIVPIAVALALGISALPAVRAGELRPIRLLQIPSNSWFAIGPVAVFALAHVDPRTPVAALLVAAFAAQFLVDFVVSSLRVLIVRGASFSSVSAHVDLDLCDRRRAVRRRA